MRRSPVWRSKSYELSAECKVLDISYDYALQSVLSEFSIFDPKGTAAEVGGFDTRRFNIIPEISSRLGSG